MERGPYRRTLHGSRSNGEVQVEDMESQSHYEEYLVEPTSLNAGHQSRGNERDPRLVNGTYPYASSGAARYNPAVVNPTVLDSALSTSHLSPGSHNVPSGSFSQTPSTPSSFSRPARFDSYDTPSRTLEGAMVCYQCLLLVHQWKAFFGCSKIV